MTVLVECRHQSHYTLIQMDDGKANALGVKMLAQLNTALEQAEQAGKATVICGRPGRFSAGFDLSVMGQGGDAMVSLLRSGANLSLRMLEFPAPLILAVSGHALAMGALMLLSADYRIGVQGSYKIGLNEVAIGLTLPYFAVELARARIPCHHLDAAASLATVYDPTGAVAVGYLDRVVGEDRLVNEAIAAAEQFANLNLEAHAQTKARLRQGLVASLREAIDRELGA